MLTRTILNGADLSIQPLSNFYRVLILHVLVVVCSAILACLKMRQLMAEMRLSCSCGITSGLALCGLVGSGSRREYTVLGDVVNLSARLMQAACGETKGTALRKPLSSSSLFLVHLSFSVVCLCAVVCSSRQDSSTRELHGIHRCAQRRSQERAHRHLLTIIFSTVTLWQSSSSFAVQWQKRPRLTFILIPCHTHPSSYASSIPRPRTRQQPSTSSR